VTAWSHETLTLLAHTVHYALVAGGLVGLGWLLLPQLVTPLVTPLTTPPAARDAGPAADAGRLATLEASVPLTARPAAPPRPLPRDVALLLPLAVVTSTAAAGVHAAMGPLHFREATLFGLFFAGAALAQLGWTTLALRSVTPALLRAGVAVNLGCVVLWAATRAWGLPLGLMPTPEPVGPWDLAAAAWELGAVAACAALLRARPPTSYAGLRLPAWVDWHRGAATTAVVSVLALLVLSLSGAGG
jgi:hypothetical protein